MKTRNSTHSTDLGVPLRARTLSRHTFDRCYGCFTQVVGLRHPLGGDGIRQTDTPTRMGR
jgi:hypothetical protein